MVSIETSLVLLGAMLIISAFFSASETSFMSVSRIKLKKLAESRVKNAQTVLDLLANPHKLLTTILLGSNLANIAASALATDISLKIFPGELALAIVTGIMTFLILVFTDITPKSVALRHNYTIAFFAAPLLNFFELVFSPAIWFIGKITGWIINIFGGVPTTKSMTEEEIRSIVSIGAEEGAINKQELEWITRIFRLNDITVDQVMTSRTEIDALPSKTKLSSLGDFFSNVPYSRIPVYEGALDNIVGVFYVKDGLEYFSRQKRSATIDKIMRPAYFVPATKKIDKLLREFQRKRIHIAMVVDEYGVLQGIVTIEDIIEEIVGEIRDEDEPEVKIEKAGENAWVADGTIELSDLNKELGSNFQSDEVDTVSGLILKTIDRIPKKNEKIKIGNYLFHIKQLSGTKIERVRISLK